MDGGWISGGWEGVAGWINWKHDQLNQVWAKSRAEFGNLFISNAFSFMHTNQCDRKMRFEFMTEHFMITAVSEVCLVKEVVYLHSFSFH